MVKSVYGVRFDGLLKEYENDNGKILHILVVGGIIIQIT